MTIVRHRAIDVARQSAGHVEKRVGDDQLDAVPALVDVAESVADGAETRQLCGLLALLPEAQREVITLAFFGQLTHNEIADRLGLPAGTVKSRARLGLHKLRAALEATA